MGSSIQLYALVLAIMPSYEKAGLLADDVVRLDDSLVPLQ